MIAQAHQQALQQHGFGVYVHWPFCLSKCPYCDFNSHVRHAAIDEERFARAFATEIATVAAQTPGDYTRALVKTVTATDSVAFFAEALALTRRRPDLAPLVERTIERLHAEGMRAYAAQIARHGWRSLRDPDASSRRFWALAIGVMVEGFAMGRSPEEMATEMLRVLGDQATTKASGSALRLVGSGVTEETSGESET